MKVVRAFVNPADLSIRDGIARLFSGQSKPEDPRLGKDIAGRVEAVGANVTQFKPGDEV
jgi:NADPH:quinone reductase-like Zn-dependent oxidoreductase